MESVGFVYRQFTLHFELARETVFDVFPTFVIRSILGKELRSLACIFKGRQCDECGLVKHCPVSILFETPLSKDEAFMRGLNRGAHPFVFWTEVGLGQKVRSFPLFLTIIGCLDEAFPFIYGALLRGSRGGILRERIPYEIVGVESDGVVIGTKMDTLDMKTLSGAKCFTLSLQQDVRRYRQYRIVLSTPLRLKHEGRYMNRLDPGAFLASIQRRLWQLSALYGEAKTLPRVESHPSWQIRDINVRWQDLSHYSARQKRLIKLGGLVGDFVLEGEFSPYEEGLLEAATLFHAGKNVAFGLGRVEMREKTLAEEEGR
ncbi:hypothetical protein BREVNS_1737 [Brevinematales bacterium NS]|nr:CRISPR system precrRNA processing endoribonuclease RAMP protein Cas6 [Brevinematales bacterium]QJR22487.1 hypothetical protein BREVNS_1737 [Brevinematales bacterium NS]